MSEANEDMSVSERERAGAFWLFVVVNSPTLSSKQSERAGAFWLFVVPTPPPRTSTKGGGVLNGRRTDDAPVEG